MLLVLVVNVRCKVVYKIDYENYKCERKENYFNCYIIKNNYCYFKVVFVIRINLLGVFFFCDYVFYIDSIGMYIFVVCGWGWYVDIWYFNVYSDYFSYVMYLF